MFGLKLYLMGSVLTCLLTALFLRGAGRDPSGWVESPAGPTSTPQATESPMARSCAPAASSAN